MNSYNIGLEDRKIIEEMYNAGAKPGEIAARIGANVAQLLRLSPNLLPSDFVSGQVICLPTKRRVVEESEPEA